MYDLIIIGTGCSGFAAAMYAGRFRMKTLILGDLVGGLITWTDNVENYPGFNKISGIDLANKLKEQALQYDIEMKELKVTNVEKTRNGFKVYSDKKSFETKTIIFATGTQVKKLDVKGEIEFHNNGVHYCALCDSYAYQDKVIAVVGGSDSAAKEALVLSEHGKKVFMISRSSTIHPEPINMDRIKKNKKIEIIYNTNILEIKGNKVVQSITLDKSYKGSKELKLDAVFIAIGHLAMSDLAKNLNVILNNHNEIIIDRESKTNIDGIYAAGDVADTRFKQAIIGVGEAVNAVFSAYNFINNKK